MLNRTLSKAVKIISLNLNGIRAAFRKGFFRWMSYQKADVVCLQETKAQVADLSDEILRPANWYSYFSDAKKKGYSGVAIYSRIEPQFVEHSFGFEEADDEGRFLLANFGSISIVSVYFPSGSSGEVRQASKYRFLKQFGHWLSKCKKNKVSLIVCGDWNIAHKKVDIKNWRSNQKNSGFLPEERAWLDWALEKCNLSDAFRLSNPAPDEFTWWSNRGRAWEKNVGWRIDYQMVTKDLVSSVEKAAIYRKSRFSDHAPLSITYNYSLKR